MWGGEASRLSVNSGYTCISFTSKNIRSLKVGPNVNKFYQNIHQMAPFKKKIQSTVAISMRLCNAPHIPPLPRKLSHRYATEVDFEIYGMGPLSPLHGR